MATIYKTPEGAYFEKTDKGYSAVNDPNIFRGLYSGSVSAVPFTDYKSTATQYSNVPATPSLIPKPVQPSQPQGDPMSRLSTGIMDMLKNAQLQQREAETQKADLQRQSFAAGQTQFTGEEARTLSPDAKMNALKNETKMYSPSIDALSTRIKQIGDIMSLMKTTYKDGDKYFPATEEDAATVIAYIRNGGTPTEDMLKKYGKWIKPDDFAAWRENKYKDTNSKSYVIYNKGVPMLFDPDTGKATPLNTKGSSSGREI